MKIQPKDNMRIELCVSTLDLPEPHNISLAFRKMAILADKHNMKYPLSMTITSDKWDDDQPYFYDITAYFCEDDIDHED